MAGFIDATLLLRVVPRGVEFLVITHRQSPRVIQAFAGTDAELAVVPPQVREMMVEYEARARHDEIVPSAT